MSDLIRREERRLCVISDSSAIRKLAYAVNAQELAIEFTSGSCVVHRNVPPGVYKDMLVAKSVGNYYDLNVKDNYETTTV